VLSRLGHLGGILLLVLLALLSSSTISQAGPEAGERQIDRSMADLGSARIGSPRPRSVPGHRTSELSQVPPWVAGPRQGPDASAWLEENRDLVEATRVAQPQVVLMGASIMARWFTVGRSCWDRYLQPLGALDLAIPGDTTQNLLWQISHGVLDGIAPKVVVLLIGMDDLAEGWSPTETFEGITADVAAIRAALPHTSILLLGLPPRGQTSQSPWRQVVSRVDDLLAADQLGEMGVTYANVGSELLQPDGTLLPGVLDPEGYLHPTAAGYDVLGAAVDPFIVSLVR
jgi:hypothetical protein